jgi:hypothetical protein
MYRKYQPAERIHSKQDPSLKEHGTQMDTPTTHIAFTTIPLTKCVNELYGKHYFTPKWVETDWCTGKLRAKRHF